VGAKQQRSSHDTHGLFLTNDFVGAKQQHMYSVSWHLCVIRICVCHLQGGPVCRYACVYKYIHSISYGHEYTWTDISSICCMSARTTCNWDLDQSTES
jgi:hypothetical protein